MLSLGATDDARNFPLFTGLAEQEKDSLMKGGRLHKVPCGQMLFTHGDAVTHFYLVMSGTVQLFRATPDGHEKPLRLSNRAKRCVKMKLWMPAMDIGSTLWR